MAHPELFPKAANVGYTFHDKYQSRKLELPLRRIKLKQNQEVFTIRPSLVLLLCVGRTDKVEKAPYLRLWGVPFTMLAYVLAAMRCLVSSLYRAWARQFGRRDGQIRSDDATPPDR